MVTMRTTVGYHFVRTASFDTLRGWSPTLVHFPNCCIIASHLCIPSALATSAHDYRLGPTLKAYLTAAPSHTLSLTQDESQSNQTFHMSLLEAEQYRISISEAGT
ncbi:hypothetical protein CY34DRAFT_711698 [Suillus luteus UH-Slu-Lm8-n1]|uniref:Uncharacterized protein n=1 Tax=Suillus luteus UH-Slu-Lm8-n1 TaxID=930992 RepID=A0A0D0AGQ3_9AGAM|nr:hypothetical protein CY34DRAFT_711698 [Suillus luteus UH-Slu-Lm8-n1]